MENQVETRKVSPIWSSIGSILVVALEGIHKSIESMPPCVTAANEPLEDSGWIQQEDQPWQNYEDG